LTTFRKYDGDGIDTTATRIEFLNFCNKSERVNYGRLQFAG